MLELNLALPKVETETIDQNYGRFVISPLERGYGVTLGNTLHRILLSSLYGAAVTSVRIDGVKKSDDKIANMQEDMIELGLRLKELRMRLTDDSASAELKLNIKGKGEVKAGDLEVPEEVEILNPDLHLLTASSAKANMEIELMVETGQGYSPAEERGDLPPGTIPIDAIFTPVLKADYKVERARVGQATDYDRLVFEVTTDGTITPQDALRGAASLSVQHFSLVAEISPEAVQDALPEEEPAATETLEIPIEELQLTVRTYNSLKRAGITQVGEIIEKLHRSPEELKAIRNFGQKSLNELIDRLDQNGYLEDVDEANIAIARSG